MRQKLPVVPSEISQSLRFIFFVEASVVATDPTQISQRFSGNNSKSLKRKSNVICIFFWSVLGYAKYLKATWCKFCSCTVQNRTLPYRMCLYSRVILAWYHKYVTWPASKVVTELNPLNHRVQYSVPIPLCTVPYLKTCTIPYGKGTILYRTSKKLTVSYLKWGKASK